MWNMQNISKADKVTLLKTAAQSILNFWMSLLLIPLDVCDTIEKRMNAYWWGGNEVRNGIKWTSWERLCEVKEGGLGFKSLRDFNIAMLAKQAWRLMNNVNPLGNCSYKRYYGHSEFLDATVGVNPSYMLRSIMATQDVMKQGARRKIGDGHETRIWKIPWLPCHEKRICYE